MSNIIIRKARQSDLKKIAELYKEAFSETYKEPWTIKTALERIKFYYKNKEILLIMDKSRMLGFIVFAIEPWHSGKRGVIIDMAIVKEFRRQGFGKMLVNYVEENCKNKKVKSMFVESMDETADYFKKFNYVPAWNVITKELK